MAIEKIRFTGNIMKIPIRDIEVINPRQRDKERFEEIVESIERLGLLKPILVNSCFLAEKGKYELLCGEGRLLSCQKLGHETILAEIINCSRKTGYVVSRRWSQKVGVVRRSRVFKASRSLMRKVWWAQTPTLRLLCALTGNHLL